MAFVVVVVVVVAGSDRTRQTEDNFIQTVEKLDNGKVNDFVVRVRCAVVFDLICLLIPSKWHLLAF